MTREPSVGYFEIMDEKQENRAEEKIAITGEVTADQATCKFIVDCPVYPGKSAYFGNRESAEASFLARKIFEIPEIINVLIADNRVTVSKTGAEPWPEVGKRVGTKIREHIRSGEPAVDASYAESVSGEDVVRRKVEELFEKEINPALGSHGGWVELVDIKGSSVYVRLGGGCQGCASAKMTLKMGIEKIVREKIPEVAELLDATDHSTGSDPYYKS